MPLRAAQVRTILGCRLSRHGCAPLPQSRACGGLSVLSWCIDGSGRSHARCRRRFSLAERLPHIVQGIRDTKADVVALQDSTPAVRHALTAADSADAFDLVGVAKNGRFGEIQLYRRAASLWRAAPIWEGAGVSAELTLAAEGDDGDAAAAQGQRPHPRRRAVISSVDLTYRGKSLGRYGTPLASAQESLDGSPYVFGTRNRRAHGQLDVHREMALRYVSRVNRPDILVGNFFMSRDETLPGYKDAWVLAGSPPEHERTTNTFLTRKSSDEANRFYYVPSPGVRCTGGKSRPSAEQEGPSTESSFVHVDPKMLARRCRSVHTRSFSLVATTHEGRADDGLGSFPVALRAALEDPVRRGTVGVPQVAGRYQRCFFYHHAAPSRTHSSRRPLIREFGTPRVVVVRNKPLRAAIGTAEAEWYRLQGVDVKPEGEPQSGPWVSCAPSEQYPLLVNRNREKKRRGPAALRRTSRLPALLVYSETMLTPHPNFYRLRLYSRTLIGVSDRSTVCFRQKSSVPSFAFSKPLAAARGDNNPSFSHCFCFCVHLSSTLAAVLPVRLLPCLAAKTTDLLATHCPPLKRRRPLSPCSASMLCRAPSPALSLSDGRAFCSRGLSPPDCPARRDRDRRPREELTRLCDLVINTTAPSSSPHHAAAPSCSTAVLALDDCLRLEDLLLLAEAAARVGVVGQLTQVLRTLQTCGLLSIDNARRCSTSLTLDRGRDEAPLKPTSGGGKLHVMITLLLWAASLSGNVQFVVNRASTALTRVLEVHMEAAWTRYQPTWSSPCSSVQEPCSEDELLRAVVFTLVFCAFSWSYNVLYQTSEAFHKYGASPRLRSRSRLFTAVLDGMAERLDTSWRDARPKESPVTHSADLEEPFRVGYEQPPLGPTWPCPSIPLDHRGPHTPLQPTFPDCSPSEGVALKKAPSNSTDDGQNFSTSSSPWVLYPTPTARSGPATHRPDNTPYSADPFSPCGPLAALHPPLQNTQTTVLAPAGNASAKPPLCLHSVDPNAIKGRPPAAKADPLDPKGKKAEPHLYETRRAKLTSTPLAETFRRRSPATTWPHSWRLQKKYCPRSVAALEHHAGDWGCCTESNGGVAVEAQKRSLLPLHHRARLTSTLSHPDAGPSTELLILPLVGLPTTCNPLPNIHHSAIEPRKVVSFKKSTIKDFVAFFRYPQGDTASRPVKDVLEEWRLLVRETKERSEEAAQATQMSSLNGDGPDELTARTFPVFLAAYDSTARPSCIYLFSASSSMLLARYTIEEIRNDFWEQAGLLLPHVPNTSRRFILLPLVESAEERKRIKTPIQLLVNALQSCGLQPFSTVDTLMLEDLTGKKPAVAAAEKVAGEKEPITVASFGRHWSNLCSYLCQVVEDDPLVAINYLVAPQYDVLVIHVVRTGTQGLSIAMWNPLKKKRYSAKGMLSDILACMLQTGALSMILIPTGRTDRLLLYQCRTAMTKVGKTCVICFATLIHEKCRALFDSDPLKLWTAMCEIYNGLEADLLFRTYECAGGVLRDTYKKMWSEEGRQEYVEKHVSRDCLPTQSDVKLWQKVFHTPKRIASELQEAKQYGSYLVVAYTSTEHTAYCQPRNPIAEVNYIISVCICDYQGRLLEPWIKYANRRNGFRLPSLEGYNVLVAHDAKRLLLLCDGDPELRRFLDRGGRVWCVMLAEYLLDAQRCVSGHNSIHDIALRHGVILPPRNMVGVGAETLTLEFHRRHLLQAGPEVKKVFESQLRKAQEQSQLLSIAHRMDSLLAMAHMESVGICIDAEEAGRQNTTLQNSMVVMDHSLEIYVPPEMPVDFRHLFDWGSPSHLHALMFGGVIDLGDYGLHRARETALWVTNLMHLLYRFGPFDRLNTETQLARYAKLSGLEVEPSGHHAKLSVRIAKQLESKEHSKQKKFRVILFDVETTGLNAATDEIIEVALYDPVEDVSFRSLVQPRRRITPRTIGIHHITEEEARSAPTSAVVMQGVVKFLRLDAKHRDVNEILVMIGHNVFSLDEPMLRRAIDRYTGDTTITDGILFCDSLTLLRGLKMNLQKKVSKKKGRRPAHRVNRRVLEALTTSLRLSKLIESLGIVAEGELHRAETDTRALWRVLVDIFGLSKRKPEEQRMEVLGQAASSFLKFPSVGCFVPHMRMGSGTHNRVLNALRKKPISDEVLVALHTHGVEVAGLLIKRQRLERMAPRFLISQSDGQHSTLHADQRIRQHIDMTHTVTTRTSSGYPSCQNISKTVPRAASSFPALEQQGGLEIVILAILSRDAKLVNDLRNGIDFHIKRAEFFSGIPYEQIQEGYQNGVPKFVKLRKMAKQFSFQRLYGAGVSLLHKTTGISVKDLQQSIDLEEREYPGITHFYRTVRAVALRPNNPGLPTGYIVELPTGCRIHFKTRDVVLNLPPVKNYPIQAYGAEISQIMVGQLYRHFLKKDFFKQRAFIVNFVHDSVWLDCHKDVLKQCVEATTSILSSVHQYVPDKFPGVVVDLPLRVSASVGVNMHTMEPWQSGASTKEKKGVPNSCCFLFVESNIALTISKRAMQWKRANKTLHYYYYFFFSPFSSPVTFVSLVHLFRYNMSGGNAAAADPWAEDPCTAVPADQTHSLLALLVESAGDARDVQALKLVLGEDQQTTIEEAKAPAVEQPPGGGILVKRTASQMHNQVSTEVRSKKKVKKTTPERIRVRAARLYNEIHDLIDQYNIRKEREKFLSTGRRPEDLQAPETVKRMKEVATPVERVSSGLPSRVPESAAASNKRALPDLFKSFQMARQKHLEDAEVERSKFPLQKRGEYSDKDPIISLSLPLRRSTDPKDYRALLHSCGEQRAHLFLREIKGKHQIPTPIWSTSSPPPLHIVVVFLLFAPLNQPALRTMPSHSYPQKDAEPPAHTPPPPGLRREARQPPASVEGSSAHGGVELRLLSMGQLYKERQQKAQQQFEAQREAEEAEAMRSWRECVPRPRPSGLSPRCSTPTPKPEPAPAPSGQPRVCRRSSVLAEKRRAAEGLDGLSAADALLERQRRADHRLESLRRKEEARYSFIPRVTRRAKAVELPLSAAERLYEHAKERALEFAALAAGASTDTPVFKPAISERAAKLVRRAGHSERVEGRALRPSHQDPSCTFRPRVNAASAAIAASLGETTADRLLRPRRSKRCSPAAEGDWEREKGAPPRRAASAGHGSALSLYDRQQLWLEMRRRKLQAAQALQGAAVESECTFRPAISAKGRRAYTGAPPTVAASPAPPAPGVGLRVQTPSEMNSRMNDAQRGKWQEAEVEQTHATACCASSPTYQNHSEGRHSCGAADAPLPLTDMQAFLDVLAELERPRSYRRHLSMTHLCSVGILLLLLLLSTLSAVCAGPFGKRSVLYIIVVIICCSRCQQDLRAQLLLLLCCEMNPLRIRTHSRSHWYLDNLPVSCEFYGTQRSVTPGERPISLNPAPCTGSSSTGMLYTDAEVTLWPSSGGSDTLQYAIGADEAGRGCMAGPVAVSAVLLRLSSSPMPFAADDSKRLTMGARTAGMEELCKALSCDAAEYRERLRHQEHHVAVHPHPLEPSARVLAVSTHLQSSKRIDEMNISNASLEGMAAACADVVEAARRSKVLLTPANTAIFVDGKVLPWTFLEAAQREKILQKKKKKTADIQRVGTVYPVLDGFRAVAVVGGDQKLCCVACASVVSKVVRDDYCIHVMQPQCPAYEFSVHKGYCTGKHRELLELHGPFKELRELDLIFVAMIKERISRKEGKVIARSLNLKYQLLITLEIAYIPDHLWCVFYLPKAPLLVAPEPLADEWETNIKWDRISAAGEPPKFFNGAHTLASDNPFRIPVYDVKEAFPKPLSSIRPGFSLERATDVFFRSETNYLDALDKLAEGRKAIEDFEFLNQHEEEAATRERERFQKEYQTLLKSLEESEEQLEAIIIKTKEAFYVEHRNLLNRVFQLVLHDPEIEDAFNERVRMTAECEEVVEEYYSTHGKHVVHMEQLQNQIAEERMKSMGGMKETLHTTARELMETVIQEGQDSGAVSRRNALIHELLQLQRNSSVMLRRRDEVVSGTTDLKRLVALEGQKLQLAKTRNATLKAQLEKLKELSKKRESSRKDQSDSYVVGTEVHYDRGMGPGLYNSESDPTNMLNALRADLDRTMAELEEQTEKLQQLRHYHLIQLSGRYKPVSFSADAIKTTRSFLDPETNAAVRSAVIEALLEVDDALKKHRTQGEEADAEKDVLPHLARVESLNDRKAVQNFVAARINRLFSDLHATTPALTLLQHTTDAKAYVLLALEVEKVRHRYSSSASKVLISSCNFVLAVMDVRKCAVSSLPVTYLCLCVSPPLSVCRYVTACGNLLLHSFFFLDLLLVLWRNSTEELPLRLWTSPLTVLWLFKDAAVRYIVGLGGRFFRHSAVLYGALPALVLWLSVSYLVVPSRTHQVFQAFDVDHDGIISMDEFGQFYDRLGVQLPDKALENENAPAAFRRPDALAGTDGLNMTQFTEWWLAGAQKKPQHSPLDPYRQDAWVPYGWWREAEFILADGAYWLVLGILSSIGLGTGMHSGLMFLFPHIYRSCAAADRCGTTGTFWTYPVNPFYGPQARAFQCVPGTAEKPDSLLDRVVLVIVPCMVWGAGTAIGEVPPYLISYAAALKGKRQDPLEEPGAGNVFERTTRWMLEGIEQYGFLAVFLLSAWPNMAFDLCGMACGNFLMPFWTFFSAVLLGKAIVKVSMQAIFFVLLFSGDNMEQIVRWMGDALGRRLPSEWDIPLLVSEAVRLLEKARRSISHPAAQHDPQAAESAVSVASLFGLLVYVVMGFFCVSIIEQLATDERDRRNALRDEERAKKEC
eukprot:gene4331-3145_t